MFRPLHRSLVEKVEPQGILIRLACGQKPVAQQRPLGIADLAFKDRLLHPDAIVFTRLRHAAQPPPAGEFHRGDIVGHQHAHDSSFTSISTPFLLELLFWRPGSGIFIWGCLFRNQGQIVRQVAAQVARQNPRLDERHLRQPKILLQQRMRERVLFALLIGLNHQFAARLSKLHHATFPPGEVLGRNLLAVDQRDGQPVGQPGPEFFHQIEGQRWAVWPIGVQKAHKRVEPHAGQGGHAVMPEQRIEERQQTIDAVERRTAAARREPELLPLLLERQTEHRKVELRRKPFGATQGVELRLRRRGPGIRKAVDLAGERVDHLLKLALFSGMVSFPRRSEKTVARVLDFAGDDLAGDGRAPGGIVGSPELSPPERDAGVGDAGHARLKMPVLAEEIHRHSVLPTEVQRGRRDRARPEYADGFQMMYRDGKLAGIDGRPPAPLACGQTVGIHRHLHPQGKVVPRHVAAGRHQVERVLLYFAHALASGFWPLATEVLTRCSCTDIHAGPIFPWFVSVPP